jgi:hypothetical protein
MENEIKKASDEKVIRHYRQSVQRGMSSDFSDSPYDDSI